MTKEEFEKFINSKLPLVTEEKEINLHDINDLFNKVIDHRFQVATTDQNKKSFVKFKDLFIFLDDIINGNINKSNTKKAYNDRISEIEYGLANAKDTNHNVELYKKYISIWVRCK